MTKLAIFSNYLKNENDPKVHHPLDDQHHSKDCHLPPNKNLSMRLHYDLCRTSFFNGPDIGVVDPRILSLKLGQNCVSNNTWYLH